MTAVPLPTDNLYKFIALSGVTIFIFGFYTINNESKSVNTLAEEITNYSIKDSIWLVNFDFELELAKMHLTDSTLKIHRKKKLMKTIDSLSKELQDFNRRSAKYKSDKFQAERLKDRIEMGWKVVYGGILLMSFGFVTWYQKHQKYLDYERKLIGLKAEQKLRKVDNKEKSKN
ncbi:hypothetical protein [Sediminicola luteus]|uniref:Uncharacterized protein n=1 Tax=Sediminicola luteus TaxID=319238 RepID=A0A2A4G7K1_9FLAO|nr:hypothetical protein [Sediminicola luteus]PCE63725.1 hypothetical protein B7P33_10640 [Sediminicola luteus]